MTDLPNPKSPPDLSGKKNNKKYIRLKSVITALNKKDLNENTWNEINIIIQAFNNLDIPERDYGKKAERVRIKILSIAEKKMKLIAKNTMMTRWMAIGMSAFGVPFGIIYGLSMDNMAFLGVGIAMGMSIGVGIGIAMDKKALKENRQLDIEL